MKLTAYVHYPDGRKDDWQYPLVGHLTGYGAMLFDAAGRWVVAPSGGSVEIRAAQGSL